MTEETLQAASGFWPFTVVTSLDWDQVEPGGFHGFHVLNLAFYGQPAKNQALFILHKLTWVCPRLTNRVSLT